MIKGKAVKFGSNVDTDQIIPAQYLSMATIAEMAPHAFEHEPLFAEDYSPGDIIAAGYNFGCGSSREQAPGVLKVRGVSAIIARSFARIFYRNAINLGIILLECAQADEIHHGDILEIDTQSGVIYNRTIKCSYRTIPLPPFMQEILDSGGIIKFLIR